MLAHLLAYIFAFIGIWIGSGLAIGSVERLSKILRISSFAVSFVVLGFFTSVGEFSVGVNSILSDDPEIFVGNIIGASIVIFMLIIPLLAIVGKRIRISERYQGFNLPASLVVVAMPVIFSIDGRVGIKDSIAAVSMFAILVLSLQTRKGIMDRLTSTSVKTRKKILKELLRILFSVATIFVASRFVVEQTLYFSGFLNVSPFLLSLLLVSVGTNIPELSFVVRSAFMRNNQVAFGDYVGSASVNTFLFGALTLMHGEPVLLTNSYLRSLIFLVFGLFLFYFFSRTKNAISRSEGFVLLLIYILFVASEIFVHRSAFL